MNIRKRKQHDFAPVHLLPGDSLITRIKGKEVDGGTVMHEYREDINRAQTIDTIITFDVDGFDELEDNALGAVFGKKKDKS